MLSKIKNITEKVFIALYKLDLKVIIVFLVAAVIALLEIMLLCRSAQLIKELRYDQIIHNVKDRFENMQDIRDTSETIYSETFYFSLGEEFVDITENGSVYYELEIESPIFRPTERTRRTIGNFKTKLTPEELEDFKNAEDKQSWLTDHGILKYKHE